MSDDAITRLNAALEGRYSIERELGEGSEGGCAQAPLSRRYSVARQLRMVPRCPPSIKSAGRATIRRLGAAFTVLLFITACEPTPTSFEVTPPSWAIIDAVHSGGNEHFFWLPPMVGNPGSFNGAFDGGQSPFVKICDLADCAANLIAEYTTTTGPGSETVRVVSEDEHYIVNWHTNEFDVSPGQTYRISVLVGGKELGLADVELGATGKEVKNLTTGEIIGLKDGRTLPIKFRIEEGALGFTLMAVHAGGQYSCGLVASGAAYCWGLNSEGQLGDGSTSLATTPSLVAGGLIFTSLTTGYVSTCALTSDGTAYCWGSNNVGELGTPTTEICDLECSTIPILVSGGHTFQSLSVGESHACGISGNVTYCWGFNFHGQLGNGSSGGFTLTPAPVLSGHVFASISAGERHTCGLKAGGEAYCWGFGFYGVLGNGSTSNSSIPVPVSGGFTFASLVSTSNGHACGLTTAGAALCWGRNDFGQVGDGSTTNVSSPVPVVGGVTFASLSVSYTFSCGATGTGDALCWGGNALGQLGNGTTSDSSTPILVAGDLTFISVGATNGQHACGITPAGLTYCWGRGLDGELGNGTTVNSLIPVQVSQP